MAITVCTALAFALIFTFLLGQAGLDNHKFYHNGYYQGRAFVRV